MALFTSFYSDRVGDLSATSVESLMERLTADYETADGDQESLVVNRSRSFNVESRVVQRPLITDKVLQRMRDSIRSWNMKSGEGLDFNMSFSNVVIQIVPTVPSGYPGSVKVSLVDTGLSLLSQDIPDQTQTMLLGDGPTIMLFHMHYSIPIMDHRHIALRFETDCEMATRSMSVMNVYAYWKQTRDFKSAYFLPNKSTCSLLKVGYKKDLLLSDKKSLMRFVAKSLQLEDMVRDRPFTAEKVIAVVKGPPERSASLDSARPDLFEHSETDKSSSSLRGRSLKREKRKTMRNSL